MSFMDSRLIHVDQQVKLTQNVIRYCIPMNIELLTKHKYHKNWYLMYNDGTTLAKP